MSFLYAVRSYHCDKIYFVRCYTFKKQKCNIEHARRRPRKWGKEAPGRGTTRQNTARRTWRLPSGRCGPTGWAWTKLLKSSRYLERQCSRSGFGSTGFGPSGSGSGSISQRHGSGSFYHQAKLVRKTTLDSYCYMTSFGLFIFGKWWNCTFKQQTL